MIVLGHNLGKKTNFLISLRKFEPVSAYCFQLFPKNANLLLIKDPGHVKLVACQKKKMQPQVGY